MSQAVSSSRLCGGAKGKLSPLSQQPFWPEGVPGLTCEKELAPGYRDNSDFGERQIWIPALPFLAVRAGVSADPSLSAREC